MANNNPKVQFNTKLFAYIKKIRRFNNKDIAAMTGISPNALSFWTNNRSIPYPINRKKLAKCLNVDEDDLFIPADQKIMLTDTMINKYKSTAEPDINPDSFPVQSTTNFLLALAEYESYIVLNQALYKKQDLDKLRVLIERLRIQIHRITFRTSASAGKDIEKEKEKIQSLHTYLKTHQTN